MDTIFILRVTLICLHKGSYTMAYNCHSMKQFSWVIPCKNFSLTHDKTIFQINLWQNCILTYDKTIFQFNLWQNAVWPMTNSQIELWQKHTLTYDNTVTPIPTNLHHWASILCCASGRYTLTQRLWVRDSLKLHFTWKRFQIQYCYQGWTMA